MWNFVDNFPGNGLHLIGSNPIKQKKGHATFKV